MAYQYSNEVLMCRCSKTTKLYKQPTDINPTIEAILEAGQTFISERSVTSGKKVLRQITSSANNSPVPTGYWCPSTVLTTYPVEIEDETEDDIQVEYDDSIVVDEVFTVKSSKMMMYQTKDGSAIYLHGLSKGDKIYVDRQVTVNCNGTLQTRYRVKATDPTRGSLVGKWILWNGYVGSSSDEEVSAPVLRTATQSGSALFATTAEVLSTFTNTVENTITPRDGDTTDDSTETGDYIADGQISKMSDDAWQIYINQFDNGVGISFTSLQGSPIGRMMFVHGMPFQYTYITDRRLGAQGLYGNTSSGQSGNNNQRVDNPMKDGVMDMYGRTFAKEIAGNMPIMVLIPGEPEYLTKVGDVFFSRSASGDEVEAFSAFWTDQTDFERRSTLEQFLDVASDSTYDYFSFRVNMTQYYIYANSPCRTAAALMGLQDRYIGGEPCTKFDWSNYNQNATHDYNMFEEVIGLGEGISFAYDPLSSVSDTMTNSTTESQLSGLFNQIGSTTRELQFFAGQLGADEFLNLDGYEESLANAGLGEKGWFSRVTDTLGNITKGFNIRFPEIWADSSHSRSYDVDMHFITPYATDYCKWRYVICPFLLLFAMAAPHAPRSQSIYGRPFLIRAFSLGYFNVENGIIESITWKRFGDGDMISQNGIPTQIDVSISFKDLYHVLTMGNTAGLTNMGAYFANTGFMDLIGTLSGVNINYQTLGQRISFYASTSINMITDLPSTFMRSIQDRFHAIADSFIYRS